MHFHAEHGNDLATMNATCLRHDVLSYAI